MYSRHMYRALYSLPVILTRHSKHMQFYILVLLRLFHLKILCNNPKTSVNLSNTKHNQTARRIVNFVNQALPAV